MWLTSNEKEIIISDTGETMINFSFDTAMIQSQGYDGPFIAEFDLMDQDWTQLDYIRDYQTQAYLISGMGDIRPAYFTGSFSDYLYPVSSPEYVKVNVTLQVN